MKFTSSIAVLFSAVQSEATCQFSANTKVNVPYHKWHAVHASTKEECCQKCADDSVCEFSTFHSKVNSCRLKSGPVDATLSEADTYTCQQGASKNIVEVAESVGDLSTLVAAVVAGDLAETLSSAGPFTVFAPTNDAFGALPSDTLDALMKPENKATLVDILTFHVVSAQAYSGDLKHGQKIATVQGGSVTVDTRSGVKINNANVVIADVLASNGVAHVIDAVLLQPEQPKLNIVELAESVGDLSTLVGAVVAGELVDTLTSAGPFTVFAPTNEAFGALSTGTLDSLMKPENKDSLVNILTYHVLPSQVLSTDLTSFQRVRTVQGSNVHVYKDSRNGVRVTPDGRDFKTVASADNLATNGVVHIIDGVLIPPSHVAV